MVMLGVLLAIEALSILVVIGAGKYKRDLPISKSYENKLAERVCR